MKGSLAVKPFPRPKLKRLERRKYVTIAAGFVCNSGIVLCADTQEQAGYIKTTGQKIFGYKRDWCNAVFAGAGNADLIDSLIEQIADKLDEGHNTQKSVIAAMRSAVLEFHQNEVAYYPGDGDDRLIEMLVGIKPHKERELLCKITGPAIKMVPAYAVIGTGTLVRYIAQRLYRDDMPINHGIYASIYLLAMAKKYVSGCGESTHIFTIRSDNSMQAETVVSVMDQEMNISRFESDTRDLLFAPSDLAGNCGNSGNKRAGLRATWQSFASNSRHRSSVG